MTAAHIASSAATAKASATFIPQRARGLISAEHSGLDMTIDKSKEMSDRTFVSAFLSHVGNVGCQGIDGRSAEAIIK